MFQKVSIADVKIEWLNTKCLIHISKFARALHRHNGTIINLQDKNVLSEIVSHARSTDSPELNSIYLSLKDELRTVLARPSVEKDLVKFTMDSRGRINNQHSQIQL